MFLDALYTLPMPETKNAKAQDTKADEPLRRRLVEFVEKHGEKEATRLLGIPRQTLARVGFPLEVRRATLDFVRRKLDELAPVDSTDTTKGTDHE